LKKALNGHPDSGIFWEEHCEKHVKSVGFEPVGPEWPSCYFNHKLKLFLGIYVDDFKLAGLQSNLRKGWSLLRSGLSIDAESSAGLYLGCAMTRGKMKLPNGFEATTHSYDMENYLKMSVRKYVDLAGLVQR